MSALFAPPRPIGKKRGPCAGNENDGGNEAAHWRRQ